MNQVVAFIVGIHVLAHSVFGCCAHHGVATPGGPLALCCSTDDAHTHRAHAHTHHECDHATEEAADVGDDQSPAEQHDCRHESCQWLAGKAEANVDVQQLSIELPCQSFTNDALSFLPSSAASLLDGISHHQLAPALRSHLRLGVLLI